MINDEVIGTSKVRSQSNFDERFARDRLHDDTVLHVEAPARSPQKCERYTASELRPLHMDEANPRQFIISETSPINDVVKQLRVCVEDKRRLRKEYVADLRQKWKSLLASNPRSVVWYKKTTTMAFRKAKWKKIPTGRSKVIRERVYLKARPMWIKRRVRVGTRSAVVKVFVPNFRPHVMREKIVPIYQKLMLRPAGLRRVVVRVKQTRGTYDWTRIKPAYVVYKIERRASLDAALAQLQSKLNTLHRKLRKLVQQPHRLVAYSDAGYIPPSWKEYYYQHYREIEPYDAVYAEAFKPNCTVFITKTAHWLGPVYPHAFSIALHGAVGVDRFTGGVYSEESSALARMRQMEDSRLEWPASRRLPFEAKGMLYPRTVVGRMQFLDGSTDQVDDQLEALAASTVRSLRNKSDYVFNLPRSIGELKDSKETFKQGADFLRWVARGTRTRNSLPMTARVTGFQILERSGSAGLALIGAYLAWKFAIQPTIQDCLTFQSQTREWLLATRRHLLKTIETLRNLSSNILHIRAKFRGDDAVRQKSLKNIAADIGISDDVIVEMTQSTHLTSPQIVARSHSSGSQSERDRLNSYDVTPSSWVPTSNCSPMQVSEDSSVQIETTMSDPSKGPMFRLDFPSGAFAARCQFFNEEWNGPSEPLQTPWEQGVSDLDIPLTGLDDLKSCYEKQDWPKAEVVGYLKNHVEGVAFARYVFSDVLEFLEMDKQSNGLVSLQKLVEQMLDWDKVFDLAYQTASKNLAPLKQSLRDDAAILASWDAVYVAWQLTPLSFIYDWFTTSESLATMLNNFETEYFVPAPPAMEGTWVTKRCELLAGRPGLTIDSSKVRYYVSDWWTGAMRFVTHRPASEGGGTAWDHQYYVASPKTVMSSMVLTYKVDRKVDLARSGLYVAKRGEFIAGGWETFLPQIQVKLTTSKVGTLLGILAGFIAPRR